MSKGVMMLRSAGLEAGSLRRVAVLAVLAAAALLLLHDAQPVSAQAPGVPRPDQMEDMHLGFYLWWEESSGASGYDIQIRSESGGAWGQWSAVSYSGTTQPAIVTGLTHLTKYQWRIRATAGGQQSAWSTVLGDSRDTGTATIFQIDKPNPPILHSATPGPGRVTLRWEAGPPAMGVVLSGYRISYRWEDGQGGTTTGSAGPFGPDVTSADVTGLTAGVEYYFGVVPLVDGVGGAWSRLLQATPQAPQSTDATLSDLTIANATSGSDADAGAVWPFGDRAYVASMLREVASITVRPTATAGDLAAITVQLETGGTPQTVASGADSAAIAITPRADSSVPHNIIIRVTAENGDTLAHTLKVYQYPPVGFGGATIPDLTFTQGARVEHGPLPSGSDDYEVTYAATGLPAGLSLSGVHRAIVGTPTAATASPASVTYTAAGEFGGTASLTFNVTVAPPVAFDAAAGRFCSSRIVAFTGDEEWLDAGDDGTVTYPAASGGAGTLTYSLVESDSEQPLSAVASGITFDTATRKLGGTPAQEARKTWAVTYAAQDENGSRAACTTAVYAGGFGGI